MAEYNDPRMPNYGRANYGQLAPNMAAANSQSSAFSQSAPQSPMMASLQRAPSMPAMKPASSGLPKNAVGTFGPNASAYAGIKNRGQTDFRKGGWQGGFNLAANTAGIRGPFGGTASPFGIMRRAKDSKNDYAVNDAQTILQRGYQSAYGKELPSDQMQEMLAGQGLKQGDRWVGRKGLDSLLSSFQAPAANVNTPPIASGFEQNPVESRPPSQDIAGQFQQLPDMSAMGSALQPKQSAGAQQAYQEYVSEFGPEDTEVPMDFQTFSGYFDQLESQPSPMSAAVGRTGWEGLNLDMQGENVSPMGLNGFNTERAFAGGDTESVEDAFARSVASNPVDLRGKSKEEVGAYLASDDFMKRLAAQGIQARPIPGSYDQIEVFTKERGWEVKDIVSNAGSDDAQWWWGDVGGEMMGGDAEMGLMDGYDYGQDEDPTQSALLSSATGGSNWKTLLDQLLAKYTAG